MKKTDIITDYDFENLLFSLGLYKEIEIDYSKLKSSQLEQYHFS